MLLIVFGSLVAGLVPLLMAIVAITIALALLALVGQAFALSVFATNMLTGMGLALGIDYSLFGLSLPGGAPAPARATGRDRRRRPRRTARCCSAASRSRSPWSACCWFRARSCAARRRRDRRRSRVGRRRPALLPALLSLLGDRVNALRIPFFGRAAEREESPFWSRAVRGVIRRPLISLVLSTAVLLALAAPVLALRSGEAGVSTLPDRLAAKEGYLALNAEFPGETTEPVEVMIDGDAASPAVQGGIDRLRARLARADLFGRPELETNRAGDLTILTIPIQGDPHGAQAVDAVRELRDELIPGASPIRRRRARRRRHRRVDRRIRHDERLARGSCFGLTSPSARSSSRPRRSR